MTDDSAMQNGSQGLPPELQSTQQVAGKDSTSEYSQIAGIISDLDRRLRVLEERYGNLRKKIQLTDTNLIDSERSFGKELRSFNSDLLELKRSANDFSEKTDIFGSEMDNVASKTDVKVIEKYLALWSPTMFVTRRELREYLKSRKTGSREDDEENDES